ncbi:hypothetical protein [Methylobacillus flagellatus]|uniref:Uncharacterized protein n=1 Tax=Methylobacillus flagellatus (strain ATCC 51484 / DSM 6875 / VKM B-1610 / KT) TaxID=265072 RepID=Q1H1A9_METFK|nr:hypothetical protein [Methylobacillus flagellatus]ABE49728.1 hypothetical protein Mfla_1460 [Methylobacillus flagellatus KT]
MKPIKKTFIALTAIAALTIPVAAKAFLPLAGIAILVSAGDLGGPLLISGLGFANLVAALSITAKDNNSNSDLASKPITVQIDPDKPLTVPEGWQDDKTPPPSMDVQLSCPASTSSRAECQNYGVCKYTLTTTYADDGNGRCAVTMTVSEVDFVPNQYNVVPGTFPGGTVDKVMTCPPGYSGTTSCVLQNPEQVKKPEKGKDEFRREGNQFVRDPQQNPADNNPNLVQEAPNRISYTDASTGEKVTIELNSATGGATVTHTVPNYGNNTTSQQVTTISGGSGSGSGSTVSGQSTATYPGTGDLTGTTLIPGGTGSGTGDCAHCATEVTLSNLRDITYDTRQLLSGQGAQPELAGQGLPDVLNASQDSTFTTLTANMRSMVNESGLLQLYTEKVLPASPWTLAMQDESANCNLSFQFLGQSYEISICEAQPYLHPALAFIFFVLTAIGVFNLITERPEGGA